MRSEPDPKDPDSGNPEETSESFGTRLLAALRGEGLPLSGFDYRTIQELKQADREEAIRILRRGSPGLSYAMIQHLRTEEPAEIARRLAVESARAKQQVALLMLFAMIS